MTTKHQLARLRALREQIASIPAARIDMYAIPTKGADCGCALHHANISALGLPTKLGITPEESFLLFALSAGYRKEYGTSEQAKGAPAKRKFLARLDRIIKRAERGDDR